MWAVEEGAGPVPPGSRPSVPPAQWWAWMRSRVGQAAATVTLGVTLPWHRGELQRGQVQAGGGEWSPPWEGSRDCNYWTKGVIGAASDNSGFSLHLACAGPQSCSSPHEPLGSSPRLGARAAMGEAFFLWAPGGWLLSSHCEAGAQALLCHYLAVYPWASPFHSLGLVRTGLDDLEGVFQL